MNPIQLSVIICTYNREEFIGDALESLARQDFPAGAFEVIMVDNNSKDNTVPIAEDFRKGFPEVNFRIVKETNQGLSFARNKGIFEAKGDIITFIDDDAIAKPDFIAEVLRIFREFPDADAVGGRIIPMYSKSPVPPDWMTPYISGLVSEVNLGEAIKPFDKKYPAGCNMSFRKPLLAEVGYFNTDLKQRSDDKDLFIKLRKYKKKVMYTPFAEVYHQIPASRTTKEGVIRVSKITGMGERARLLSTSFLSKILKVAEYIFKLLAAILIGVKFIAKGQSSKAYYLLLVRWYIMKGFFEGAG